jgi:hypothetical protein
VQYTVAPTSPKAQAIPRPAPLVAPDTKAILLASFFIRITMMLLTPAIYSPKLGY